MEPQSSEQVLQRLQEGLEALHMNGGGNGFDFNSALPPSKGAGPRLFCGHVPKEVTEDLVKAHFSRWGVVTDVYFPRHKKTLKRRPFCFVTFVARDSAERALAESPLNICGIPIKNLTMVEDRDKYYQEKQVHAQQALLAALQSLGGTTNVSQDQINNLAAMLVMEGVGAEAILSAAAMQQQHPVGHMNGPNSLNAAALHSLPLSYGSLPSSDNSIPQSRLDAFQGTDAAAALAALQARTSAGAGSGGFGPASPVPPLPPFSMMTASMADPSTMSRESSMCSIASADWFSSTSSRRTSVDMPGGAQTGRLSFDAGMHLHHLRSGHGQPPVQYPGGPTQYQRMLPPQGHNAAASLQSAFYQPGTAPQMPQHQHQYMPQQQHQGISPAAALQSSFFGSGGGQQLSYNLGTLPHSAPAGLTAGLFNQYGGMNTTNSNSQFSGGPGSNAASPSAVPGAHALPHSNPLPVITEGVQARLSEERLASFNAALGAQNGPAPNVANFDPAAALAVLGVRSPLSSPEAPKGGRISGGSGGGLGLGSPDRGTSPGSSLRNSGNAPHEELARLTGLGRNIVSSGELTDSSAVRSSDTVISRESVIRLSGGTVGATPASPPPVNVNAGGVPERTKSF